MNSEATKLELIEALLKVDDETLLRQLKIVLQQPLKARQKKTFSGFSGTLTEQEANEWLKNIEEGCEQINPDDWK